MSRPVSKLKRPIELNRVTLAGKLILTGITDLKREKDKEGKFKGFHCDQYADGCGIPLEIGDISYGLYISKNIYIDISNNFKGYEYMYVLVEGKLTPGNDVYNGDKFVYPIVVDVDNIVVLKRQEI